jgi:replicative DNA helicase
MSIEAQIESQKIRKGRLSGDEFSRVVGVSELLKNAPLHVIDEAGIRAG